MKEANISNVHCDYAKLPKETLYGIKFKTTDDFILRSVADENILIPIGNSQYFDNSIITLNETAAFLWNLFTDGMTIQEAIKKSQEQYCSSLKILENSIVNFVLENSNNLQSCG